MQIVAVKINYRGRKPDKVDNSGLLAAPFVLLPPPTRPSTRCDRRTAPRTAPCDGSTEERDRKQAKNEDPVTCSGPPSRRNAASLETSQNVDKRLAKLTEETSWRLASRSLRGMLPSWRTRQRTTQCHDKATGVGCRVSPVSRSLSGTFGVIGDFGPHNILWDESGASGLIDFDNACAADRAIDVAPLIGFYGAAKVEEIVDNEVLARAKVYRASLPLQVAASAALGADRKLQSHALSNFARRLEAGSLHDPAAT